MFAFLLPLPHRQAHHGTTIFILFLNKKKHTAKYKSLEAQFAAKSDANKFLKPYSNAAPLSSLCVYI